MSILGIENRTENWRTARKLSPLVEKRVARVSLASHIVGCSRRQLHHNIEFELFWHGMRDYADMRERQGSPIEPDQVVECYNYLFSDLRREIGDWRKFERQGFQQLDEDNYVADETTKERLRDNLRHSEIDIVIETQSHLCIGEAKIRADFGTNSKYILVHQLIRQYVMAKILVKLTGQDKVVVPFVIGDCKDNLLNKSQVKFMIDSSYLSAQNVLSWKELPEILGTG